MAQCWPGPDVNRLAATTVGPVLEKQRATLVSHSPLGRSCEHASPVAATSARETLEMISAGAVIRGSSPISGKQLLRNRPVMSRAPACTLDHAAAFPASPKTPGALDWFQNPKLGPKITAKAV